MYFFLTGAILLSAIIGLFWLKDRLESPLLARIAYSGLIARLAVLGAIDSADIERFLVALGGYLDRVRA